MGLKLRGVLRCGACGKPRGLGTHLCNPGRRKRRRGTLQNPVTWECSACGKKRGLVHTCHPKSDFKARRRKQATAERRRKRKATRARQAARRRETAANRRARERDRRKKAKTRTPRPRPPAHDYHVCGDEDCGKYGCTAYREGVADGRSGGLAAGHAQGHAEGHAEGYSEGYDAGAATAEGGGGDGLPDS
jgi:hypothetical protein